MRPFRRHVVSLTVGWLLFQAAGFGVTPAAVCSVCLTRSSQVAECCRNLRPGQTCPMHPDAGSDRACHVGTTCSMHDPSLLAIVAGLAGPLPVHLPMAGIAPAEPVADVEVSTVGRVVLPELPPPRC
jgi:hypothetical protein